MLLPVAFLLTSALPPLQDTPAPAPPDQASEAAAAVSRDEDSARAAIEQLERAQARLYDIRAAGLGSLSFAVPIRVSLPTGETFPLGDVSVSWDASADAQVAVEVSEELPPELARNAEEISYQLEAQGRQILRFIDNDIFTALLEGFEPSLGAPADGLTRVHFAPKTEQSDAVAVDWFFDAEDVPVKFGMSIDQHDMTMDISYEHTWAPASATDPSLVLQELTIVQEMGPMRNVITTVLDHETVGGLVVLVGYTESGVTPAGDPVSNRVELEGLALTSQGDD